MKMKLVWLVAVTLLLYFSVTSAENNAIESIPFVVHKQRIIYYSSGKAISSTTTSAHPSSETALHDTYSAMDSVNGYWGGSSRQPVNLSSPTPGNIIASSEDETSISNIPVAELKKVTSQMHNSVCASIGDGDVRVWFSIDADGKLLGVGASAESGLEVTFHCKKSKS